MRCTIVRGGPCRLPRGVFRRRQMGKSKRVSSPGGRCAPLSLGPEFAFAVANAKGEVQQRPQRPKGKARCRCCSAQGRPARVARWEVGWWEVGPRRTAGDSEPPQAMRDEVSYGRVHGAEPSVPSAFVSVCSVFPRFQAVGDTSTVVGWSVVEAQDTRWPMWRGSVLQSVQGNSYSAAGKHSSR